MYKNIDYKFLDCARKMPALYNTLPGEQYDIKKSEVISWLVKQPEIQRKIFEMAKAQKVIEYDKDLKKWKGIDSIEDPEEDYGVSEYIKTEKSFDIEKDLSGIDSIGAAIYAKCIEKDLSLTEFFSQLNKYNVYIDDLRSESLNTDVVYGASQVFGMDLYDQIQNDKGILDYFLRQLINSIEFMNVTINVEADENAPIYISLRLERNDEETIRIECEAEVDLYQDIIEIYLFSIMVERFREQVVDESIDSSHETYVLLNELCRCVREYKYIEDDILRIGRNGIKDYLLKLTDDKTIDWEWDGQSYLASMGEENYSYTYNSEEDRYELKIDIADRLVLSVDYTKDEVDELDRLIEGITSIAPEEDREYIGIEDLLVRSSNYNCANRFHHLQRIHAIVNVLKNGEVKEVRTEAAYCPECDRYYILERDYQSLKRSGTICCKIIEFEELLHNKQSFSDWQEKSILRTYGYTVSKTENLTKQERHQILDFVMENKIMTSNQIISHLVWQIETRKRMWNMQDAISKWEDDIRYVRQYQYLNKSVRVRQIFTKKRL